MMRFQDLTSNQTSVRETNLSKLLYNLQKKSALSRAGLANLTGLNKTTVSKLTEELLERGLIHEVGLAASDGGRPGTLLALNPQAGCVIGIELNVDFISAILTDFVGQIIWQKTVQIDPVDPQEKIINTALYLVDQAKVANETGQRLLGLGVTVPGLVDLQNGDLLLSPNLQWCDVPLKRIFQDYADLPVFVENDANAAALGEFLFGSARDVQDFIFLTVGIGVGCALFLNGDLYRGGSGIAGEIGHTNLMTEWNRPCYCGNKGCWETASNQYALIERIRASLAVGRGSLITELLEEKNSLLSLSVIAQAAEAEDEITLEALADTGRALGLGAAILVNLFNPTSIVIGGPLSIFGPYLLPAINQTVNQHALAISRRQTEIVISTFGASANVIGSVALIVKDVILYPTRAE